KRFFEGVSQIRMERDHPLEIRDYYNRYLAYLMVEKSPGNWVNYNVECVRAGMSPYFVKYGRSRRFHKEFLAAQEEARARKIGIWDPSKQHYDDYEERLKWWSAREEAITRFEKRMEEHPDYIALTRFDALERMEKKLGETVVLLGSVSDIRTTPSGLTLVKLSKSSGNDFDVVFPDLKTLETSGIAKNKGEYVQVRGVVAKYFDRRWNREKLQLLVSVPGQVIAPTRELEDLREEETQHAD
ncbi:MAG: thermonuclease family protein, partial [Myxococcaceae bacterium]